MRSGFRGSDKIKDRPQLDRTAFHTHNDLKRPFNMIMRDRIRSILSDESVKYSKNKSGGNRNLDYQQFWEE